jgi:hypothetical protein
LRITKRRRARCGQVIGLPLGFQPLDSAFQLPNRASTSSEALRPRLLGHAIELGLRSIKGGLIFCRKLHWMGVRPAQTMGVRKGEMGFRPFPTLGLPQGICRAPEFSSHQQIEQRHIL